MTSRSLLEEGEPPKLAQEATTAAAVRPAAAVRKNRNSECRSNSPREWPLMECSRTTIGLVQIGEVVWERRPSRQFHLVDGALRSKPVPSNSMAASLAYLPHSAGVLQAYA